MAKHARAMSAGSCKEQLARRKRPICMFAPLFSVPFLTAFLDSVLGSMSQPLRRDVYVASERHCVLSPWYTLAPSYDRTMKGP
jgi:hypothetical protein